MITVIPEKILSLTIPSITINSGSFISADEKGYSANKGPGSITTNAGASYGGAGYGNSETSTYGSDTNPTDLGSGGVYSGGGAIKLTASNILKNDGVISAQGAVSASGGSVNINANNLSGSGKFSADGGNIYASSYFKGPGGGGRVALYYQTSSFNGIVEAKGGCGSYDGWSKSCAGDGSIHIVDQSITPPPPAPVLSTLKTITMFNFLGLTPNVDGVIDETNHTVSLTVPFGTDVTAIIPDISVSPKASISPSSIKPDNTPNPQNFTNPVTYTVKAEDSSAQNYIVTVVVASDPNPPAPIPDTTPPSIESFMLNGSAASVTVNPTKTTPLLITLNASKNVEWVSIKIDKENNTSGLDIYKSFQPGSDCDGKDTCAQDWDGELSRGGVIQNGDSYSIKVRIRDLVDKKEYDFVSPYIITINTSI
jgi:hypothetical protein